MMKSFSLKLLSLALLAGSLSFVACDDDIETSSLVLDQTQEAKVTAYLYAELDRTSLGLEQAPNGTKVFVSVDNSAFNSNAKGTWIDTVYVQDGKIESVVPVTSQGVSVRITPTDFVQAQKQAHNSVSASLDKIYTVSGGSTISGVKPGEHRIHEITYSNEDFDNVKEFVERHFTIYATVNVEFGTAEVTDTEITFFNGDWSTTVKSESTGNVIVNLPKGTPTTAQFTYQKKWEAGNSNRMVYRYTTTVIPYNESSPVLGGLYFGEGSLYQ